MRLTRSLLTTILSLIILNTTDAENGDNQRFIRTARSMMRSYVNSGGDFKVIVSGIVIAAVMKVLMMHMLLQKTS
jgi:hypothetical protein